VGGVDYPRTLAEFDEWFSSEAACESFLHQIRWREGFVCPGCGSCSEGWHTGRGHVRCRECGHQTSTTAGTLFEGTRKPLRVWFQAVWYLTNQKHGVSALGLQRVLGLGSYQTAWTWMHKLRRAMVRPGRERFAGEVEVDETFLGGESEDIDGRGTDRSLIVIAAEVRGRGTGRIRMARVEDASARSLIPFIERSVVQGSSSPCRFASEAMVAGDLPWWHRRRPSRVLPRRDHLPVQPKDRQGPWATLLPNAAAGRGARPHPVPPDPGGRPQPVVVTGAKWIPTSAETSRRISCDSGLVRVTHAPDSSVLDVGRRTRTIPPALRRALEAWDRGCRFTGCGLRFCDAHHVRHWADGGETSLGNTVLLCTITGSCTRGVGGCCGTVTGGPCSWIRGAARTTTGAGSRRSSPRTRRGRSPG